jgi:hypothetical protein
VNYDWIYPVGYVEVALEFRPYDQGTLVSFLNASANPAMQPGFFDYFWCRGAETQGEYFCQSIFFPRASASLRETKRKIRSFFLDYTGRFLGQRRRLHESIPSAKI